MQNVKFEWLKYTRYNTEIIEGEMFLYLYKSIIILVPPPNCPEQPSEAVIASCPYKPVFVLLFMCFEEDAHDII